VVALRFRWYLVRSPTPVGWRTEHEPAMSHYVTERCVDCRYTYCAVECPVAAFFEIETPHAMLVIDPDICIDCEACVPACPVNAIWPDHELPEAYASWKAFNTEWAKKGTNCTESKDPLPSARLLDEIQAAEKAKGLAVTEPSKAS